MTWRIAFDWLGWIIIIGFAAIMVFPITGLPWRKL
jgi:hypothetical protein